MSFLTAITHNIPWFLRDPAIALIGTKCYTSLIYDLSFHDTTCIKYSISKVLGLGIVVGGSFVKVPQIYKIVSAKSGKGVSLLSYALDTAGLLFAVGYNWRNGFAFSTYGENVFLLIQNLTIISLLLLLSHSHQRVLFAAMAIVLPLSLLYLLTSTSPSYFPLSTLRTLLAASIPLSLASKLPQIIQNFRNRSTGQLSAFLVLNSLLGCLARVFTTSTETGDATIWWSFMLAAALNGVLAVQLIGYWDNTGKKEERLLTGSKGRNQDLERKDSIGLGPIQHSPMGNGSLSPVAIEKPRSAGRSSPRPAKQWVRKTD